MNKESKFCVFQHTRKDTNKIFYTAIGSIEKAYSKQYHPSWWYYVTDRTQYVVDILAEDLSWDEACNMERQANTGVNFKRPDKPYEGKRKRSEQHNKALASSKEKPVCQYDLKGNFIKEYPSAAAAAEALGIRTDGISNALRNKQESSGGYKWSRPENFMQYVLRTKR
jgi:hypothetical protein